MAMQWSENEKRAKISIAPMRKLWQKFKSANRALPYELRFAYTGRSQIGRIKFHDTDVRKIVISSIDDERSGPLREIHICYDGKTKCYRICGEKHLSVCFSEHDVRLVMEAAVLGWSLERLMGEICNE